MRRELIERLRDEGVRQKFLPFFGLQRNIHLNFYDPGEGIFDHIIIIITIIIITIIIIILIILM